MVNEAEDNYDVTINQSVWRNESNTESGTKYDFASAVNESVWEIGQDLRTIGNEDEGWLTRVASGFTGIVRAVIFLPDMVFTAGVMGGTLITGLGTSLGIPSYLILVFIIMLTVWGIFQLVEFFQRWTI